MPSGSALLFTQFQSFIDGAAVFEPLKRDRIDAARLRFADLVAQYPENGSMQVGLATACALAFELSRGQRTPDADMLRRAEVHAREACRLNADSAEAWATLGFVLERAGRRVESVGALANAVALGPDNWRHHLRLAFVSWGAARLTAARRTVDLLPGCAAARMLAATVFVARNELDRAEGELDAALTAARNASQQQSLVAVHWMKGLVVLSRGAEREAVEHFHCEQAMEIGAYLHATESSVNAGYAIGVCHLRHGDFKVADDAFDEALIRMPRHTMAQAASAILAATNGKMLSSFEGVGPTGRPDGSQRAVDTAIAWAALRVAAGDIQGAVELAGAALMNAPEGGSGWWLPIEPLIGVRRHADTWAPVLATLKARAL